MAQALLTAVGIGLLGLLTTAFFGLRGTDVAQHISYGLFSTIIMLLAHSMMMFYLIGKGKAVKDAMAEGNVTGDYYGRIAAIRKPVFSIGTFAMAVTIVESGTPWEASSAALHATIPTFRNRCSFDAAKARTRGRPSRAAARPTTHRAA